jgi:16S rRNA (guanine527-N7)-methyltransferase
VLAEAARALGVELSTEQQRALRRYVELLARATEHVNLTGYPTTDAMERMLVLDALVAAPLLTLPAGARVADLGSGGGSPGIPLAIMRPDCSFVLVDSRDKKVQFLRAACAELGLRHVTAVAARIEDLGRDATHREAYAMTLAKALAPLPSLIELAAPLLCDGGSLLAWKAAAAAAEVSRAERALVTLGARVAASREYVLPGGEESRTLLRIERHGPLPARFPRRVGVAQKQPL